MLNWFRNSRRKRILSKPWPTAWSSILDENVGHFKGLSSVEKNKLTSITRVMVSEKNWEAYSGLVMTDEIKVTIAGTAALMLLGVEDFYFDRVDTIIVFPQPVQRTNRGGLVQGQQSRHSGEAWQNGQVLLSWEDVVNGSRNPADGRNVVIHEFAHCLDGLDGEMGGRLTFGDDATTRRWRRVCESEFEALSIAAQHGRKTLLDHYGATNQAEFFAVASETFFEKPQPLKHEHPELFELLVKYYRLNPISWV